VPNKNEATLLAEPRNEFIYSVWQTAEKANRAIAFWNHLFEGMETGLVAYKKEYDQIFEETVKFKKAAEIGLRQAAWLLRNSEEKNELPDIVTETEQLEAVSQQLQTSVLASEKTLHELAVIYTEAPTAEKVLADIETSKTLRGSQRRQISST